MARKPLAVDKDELRFLLKGMGAKKGCSRKELATTLLRARAVIEDMATVVRTMNPSPKNPIFEKFNKDTKAWLYGIVTFNGIDTDPAYDEEHLSSKDDDRLAKIEKREKAKNKKDARKMKKALKPWLKRKDRSKIFEGKDEPQFDCAC